MKIFITSSSRKKFIIRSSSAILLLLIFVLIGDVIFHTLTVFRLKLKLIAIVLNIVAIVIATKIKEDNTNKI